MLNLGYLGGVYDAGTGLIYMGNGQYYDPSTGRFLTRGAQPDQSNPYTPWGGDPAGMLIAPLALLALVFGRKKTRTKFDQFVILLVIGLSVGLSVSACDGGIIQIGDNTTVVVTPITQRAHGRTGPDKNVPITGLHYSEAARYVRKVGFAWNTINTASSLDCVDLITDGPDPMEGDYWNDPNLQKLHEIYVRMYELEEGETRDDKWWWREYGADDDHFSLKEFYSVLMVQEVANVPGYPKIDTNDFVEAMGRRASVWCTAPRFFNESNHGCDPTTNEGAAFFLYSWSSQIKKKVGECWQNCPLDAHMDNTYPQYLEWPEKIVDAIMNPIDDYYNIVNDAPFDAGNVVPDGATGTQESKVYEMYTKFNHNPLYISPTGGTAYSGENAHPFRVMPHSKGMRNTG